MAHMPLSPEVFLGASIVFIPLSSLALGLRVVQRRRQDARFGADDWLIVVAYPLVLAMQITMLIEFKKRAIGYSHQSQMPHGVSDARANLPFYPLILESILAIGTIKLSLVFFFRRIFYKLGPNWFKTLSTVLIVLISGWAISFFFVFVGLCHPNPSAYWASAAIEKEQCVNTLDVHRAMAISDAILDIPVIGMSLPIIWSLQMSIARKSAVTGAWLLGGLTIAASIVRMVVVIEVLIVRYDPNTDFEHIVTLAIYWSMIEVGLGFLVGNLIVVYSLLVSASRSISVMMGITPSGSRSRSNRQSTTVNNHYRHWPARRGEFETSIESLEHESLHSNDPADTKSRGILATTTVSQTAHVV